MSQWLQQEGHPANIYLVHQ